MPKVRKIHLFFQVFAVSLLASGHAAELCAPWFLWPATTMLVFEVLMLRVCDALNVSPEVITVD